MAADKFRKMVKFSLNTPVEIHIIVKECFDINGGTACDKKKKIIFLYLSDKTKLNIFKLLKMVWSKLKGWKKKKVILSFSEVL